ncbi:MAG: hypothetical protein ACTSP4_05005 [Candidatus Hodarchaeales archaeon]
MSRMDVVADSNSSPERISGNLPERQNIDLTTNHPRKSVIDDYNNTLSTNYTEFYEEELGPRDYYSYEFEEEINTKLDISLDNLSYYQVERINGLEKWDISNFTRDIWHTYGEINQNLDDNSSDDSLEFFASGEGNSYAVQFDLLNISGLAIPNMYTNPTTVSFRTRFNDANDELLNSIYAIILKIEFINSTGYNGWFEFVISYSEDYLCKTVTEFSGINTSIDKEPAYQMQLWLNTGLIEDWIDVNVNVTDFLVAFMDPTQYPAVNGLYQCINSISLIVKCMDNFNFNATLLLEDLTIESLISNGGNNILKINGEQVDVNGGHISRDLFSEQVSFRLNSDIYPYLAGSIELSLTFYRQIDYLISRSRINNSLYRVVLETTATQVMDNSSLFETYFVAPDSWELSYENLSKSPYIEDPYFSNFQIKNDYFLPEITAQVTNGILDLSITSLSNDGIINIKGSCQKATGNLYLLLNGSSLSSTPPLINSSFYFVNVEIPAEIFTGDMEITVIWDDSWYYGESVLVVNRNDFFPDYLLIIDVPYDVYCFDSFRVNLTVFREEILLENLTVFFTGDFGQGILNYNNSMYSTDIFCSINSSQGELFIEVINSDNQLIKERVIVNIITGDCFLSLDTPYIEDVTERNYPLIITAQTGIIYSDTTEKSLSLGYVSTEIGNFTLDSVNVGLSGLTWINFIPARYIDDSVNELLVKCSYVYRDEILATSYIIVDIASQTENDDEMVKVAISRINHTPIITNRTFEEEFLVNYSSSGYYWISPLPYDYKEINSVYIESNGSLIPIGINETHVYWNGMKEPGETEIMIFILYSPVLHFKREIVESQPPKTTIDCHISFITSLDGVSAFIPLTIEDLTGINWTVLDFRGNDITGSLNVEINGEFLQISPFSGKTGSIINITVTTDLMPLSFETVPSVTEQIEAMDGTLLITGNITSYLPINVYCNIDNSDNPFQAVLFAEEIENHLWVYRGNFTGFYWNSSLHVSISARDSAGNMIKSSIFNVTVVDTNSPIIVNGISIGENNVTFFADSIDTGSEMKNLSVFIAVNGQRLSFTNDSGSIEYSLLTENVTYLEYYFVGFDNAENMMKTPARNITIIHSEEATNSVHFINTILVSGTLLFGGMISVNRVIHRKRVLEEV